MTTLVSEFIEIVFECISEFIFYHQKYLFSVGHILYDPNDSTSEKLNGTRIQAFFIKKMYHYCKIVLGWDDCGLYELSGCGINSDCPPNTRLMYSFLLLQQSTDYVFFSSRLISIECR